MKKYVVGFLVGVSLSVATLSFAENAVRFRDVIAGAWYNVAVSELVNIGVIGGYPDGTFKAQNPVTRGEVAQMIFRMKEYVDARFENRTLSTAPTNLENNISVSCSSLQPSPASSAEIIVGTVAELEAAFQRANQNGDTVIILKDGTYSLSKALWFSRNNIMLRSQSGNRDNVIVRGSGMNGSVDSVFHVAADNATIADITLGWVTYHPIQVHGEFDADTLLVHNVRIVDGGQQLIKVSNSASGTPETADNGIVECSLFEYTAGIGPQFYIGGIDAHRAKNWIVRENIFKNIISPEEALAEHAIHFWSNSENTLVENNIILNSDRGIGFGLGTSRGHIGGIIRNNFIYHNDTRGDVGIGLESARNVHVYNNAIYFDNDYPNAIEYRFSSTTGTDIKNNITNKAIVSRNGGTATLSLNKTNAEKNWFVDAVHGDLRLTPLGNTAIR